MTDNNNNDGQEYNIFSKVWNWFSNFVSGWWVFVSGLGFNPGSNRRKLKLDIEQNEGLFGEGRIRKRNNISKNIQRNRRNQYQIGESEGLILEGQLFRNKTVKYRRSTRNNTNVVNHNNHTRKHGVIDSDGLILEGQIRMNKTTITTIKRSTMNNIKNNSRIEQIDQKIKYGGVIEDLDLSFKSLTMSQNKYQKDKLRSDINKNYRVNIVKEVSIVNSPNRVQFTYPFGMTQSWRCGTKSIATQDKNMGDINIKFSSSEKSKSRPKHDWTDCDKTKAMIDEICVLGYSMRRIDFRYNVWFYFNRETMKPMLDVAPYEEEVCLLSLIITVYYIFTYMLLSLYLVFSISHHHHFFRDF